MAVRMKVALDDKHVAGQVCDDFSPTMERRLIRSGLAEPETLDEARARVGMERLAQGDDGGTAPDLTELRREYRETLGKAPFPGWGADELQRRIDEAGS